MLTSFGSERALAKHSEALTAMHDPACFYQFCIAVDQIDLSSQQLSMSLFLESF